MSASGPGQFGGYTPPPPPPSSKKSPWLFVGLGCGALILLSFGGCVALGMYGYNKAKQTMSEPLDVAQVKASMLDTPIYPGAKLDEMGTKGGKLGSLIFERMVPADSMAIAAYDTPDAMHKVFEFYEKELKSEGYKTVPSKQGKMDTYQKGSEIIGVEEANGTTRSDGTSFLLLRFHGVKGKSGL